MFRDDATPLRPGLAKGKYDAFLLMPRGLRDEEFHTAVCELLSDWGSTVAEPEVVTVKIVSPTQDPLTLSIRDYLDRMGMPNRVYAPDSDVGRAVLARLDGARGRAPVDRDAIADAVVELREREEPEAIAARYRVVEELLGERATNRSTVWAEGPSPLARTLTGVALGDLVSVYLAILYQTDPTPVTLLAMLKERLARTD